MVAKIEFCALVLAGLTPKSVFSGKFVSEGKDYVNEKQ